MTLKFRTKLVRASAGMAAALSLSACGGFDGVELNGKIFDAVGLNTGSVKQAEPKMRERAPLVVPPGLEAGLPEPGSGKVAQPELGIADHDASRNTSRADLERQQAEYCAKNYDANKVFSDDTAALVKGPLGDCRPSVLSAFSNKPAEAEEE
jgi:hypothetical protein